MHCVIHILRNDRFSVQINVRLIFYRENEIDWRLHQSTFSQFIPIYSYHLLQTEEIIERVVIRSSLGVGWHACANQRFACKIIYHFNGNSYVKWIQQLTIVQCGSTRYSSLCLCLCLAMSKYWRNLESTALFYQCFCCWFSIDYSKHISFGWRPSVWSFDFRFTEQENTEKIICRLSTFKTQRLNERVA